MRISLLLNEFVALAGFKTNKQKTIMLINNVSFQDSDTFIKKSDFKVEKKVKYLGVMLTNTNTKLF